jgi:hypothetical protein
MVPCEGTAMSWLEFYVSMVKNYVGVSVLPDAGVYICHLTHAGGQ